MFHHDEEESLEEWGWGETRMWGVYIRDRGRGWVWGGGFVGGVCQWPVLARDTILIKQKKQCGIFWMMDELETGFPSSQLPDEIRASPARTREEPQLVNSFIHYLQLKNFHWALLPETVLQHLQVMVKTSKDLFLKYSHINVWFFLLLSHFFS